MSENVPSTGKLPSIQELDDVENTLDPPDIYYGGRHFEAAYRLLEATRKREEDYDALVDFLPEGQLEIEREKVRILESILEDRREITDMLRQLLAKAKSEVDDLKRYMSLEL